MDRLQSQRVTAPEAGAGVPRVLAERRYAYDTKGRLTSIGSLHGEMTIYRYDRIDQLIEASRGAAREVFEYDPTGSIVNMLGDLGDIGKKNVWSLAPGNQLRATGRAKYVSDGRGRRIQRVERVDRKDLRDNAPRGDDQTTVYGWDSKDRLREVVTSAGIRVRFTYDAFGRRIRKDVLPSPREASGILQQRTIDAQAVSQRTILFLWDGDVLCAEQDSSGEGRSRSRVHVHVPGSFVPMAQVEGGEMFWVVSDHLGIPKELVDASGRVAWRATHSAWGEARGAGRDPGAVDVESPFRLLGQYADEETKLCYTRFRYFEAETGRWLSPDPLGIAGGKNLLAFDGVPTIDVDPFGLSCDDAAHSAAQFAKLVAALRTADAANALIESLRTTGGLPANFLTKDQAHAAGWLAGKPVGTTTPGGQIGGDEFQNTTNVVPAAPGRTWSEADVGLSSGTSRSKQPGTRLLYSNDGLLYVTADHYETAHPIGTWK
jgi:RHS repeat-associated protein